MEFEYRGWSVSIRHIGGMYQATATSGNWKVEARCYQLDDAKEAIYYKLDQWGTA